MTPAPDLAVLVPTRGRPANAARLINTFRGTCTAYTVLVLIVDTDDPSEYGPAVQDRAGLVQVVRPAGRPGMVFGLNTVVRRILAGQIVPFALGFMGDDHVPRTYGWDTRYLSELHQLGTGMVYGDDTIQSERLPTHIVMTSDICVELNGMVPDNLRHLYVDNYWRDVGQLAGCIRYMPDVTVQHVHPIAGTAELDDGYTRVNSPEMYRRDRDAYAQLVKLGIIRRDAARIRDLIAHKQETGA